MFKKARRFLAYITAMVMTLSLVMPAVPMTAFAKAEVNNEITNVQNVQIEFQKDGQKITNVDIEGGQQSEIDVVIKFRCDVSGGNTQIPIYLEAQMNGGGMYDVSFNETDQGCLSYNVNGNDNEARTKMSIQCNGANESSSVTINAAVNTDHYDKNSNECAYAELGINGGGNQGGGGGNAQVSDEFNVQNIQIKFRKDGQKNTAFNLDNNDETEFQVEISFKPDYHGQTLPITIPVMIDAQSQGGGVNFRFPDADNNMLTFTLQDNNPQDMQLTTRMFVSGNLDGANITFTARFNATNENQSHASEQSGVMQLTVGGGGGNQTFEDKDGKYTVVFQNDGDPSQALWVHQGSWMVLPSADELGFTAPAGQIFLGWDSDNNQNVQFDGDSMALKPTGRTLLTARWGYAAGKTYAITIAPGEAGGNAVTENVTAGESYTFKAYG
ncbi:MAG: hypothetical protein IJR33_10365, partial [Clostridia bacterium]|nr:hypothetical protein [Clostridia bacterium]